MSLWRTIVTKHGRFPTLNGRVTSITQTCLGKQLLHWKIPTKRILLRMSSAMSSSMPSAIQISADKLSALVDDEISIRVTGLEPAQAVTLTASLEEEEKIFVSHGHYKADHNGEIDLHSSESLGGTYTGIEPMGLFWSMKQAEGQKPGLRIMKRDVSQPFIVDLSAIPSHVHVTSKDQVFKDLLAHIQLKRFYLAENVRTLNVKEMDKNTRIRGRLFLPPGPGPFPGVIDMFGTAGGLTEYRAALLASRGFASLALAFFGYDDLPKYLTLELEYFKEAADWLYNQPQVLKTGVGVVGVSKGAELAIHMAILNPKVKAVVPINTYYYSHSAVHTLGGVEQASAEPAMDYWKSTEEGLDFGDCYGLNEVAEEATLKVEKAKQASFLFLCCEDDRQADPSHVQKLKERFDRHGMSNYRVILYPKAGHLLEPPYTPLARTAFHKLVGSLMLFGGETKMHADAQEHSWKEILSFLKKELSPNVSSKI